MGNLDRLRLQGKARRWSRRQAAIVKPYLFASLADEFLQQVACDDVAVDVAQRGLNAPGIRFHPGADRFQPRGRSRVAFVPAFGQAEPGRTRVFPHIHG